MAFGAHRPSEGLFRPFAPNFAELRMSPDEFSPAFRARRAALRRGLLKGVRDSGGEGFLGCV